MFSSCLLQWLRSDPGRFRALKFFSLLILLLSSSCFGTRARSELAFDEIKQMVQGKTAQEVVEILGQPDSRQEVFDDDERWIWWNYTFLDGSDYPPEARGRVVHLEILFKNPARRTGKRPPYSEWYVDRLFGVRYKVTSSMLETLGGGT